MSKVVKLSKDEEKAILAEAQERRMKEEALKASIEGAQKEIQEVLSKYNLTLQVAMPTIVQIANAMPEALKNVNITFAPVPEKEDEQ